MAFNQLSVFGYSAAYALAPASKTGVFQLAAHQRNYLALGEPGTFFNFLKSGTVLPRITNDFGDFLGGMEGFHPD